MTLPTEIDQDVKCPECSDFMTEWSDGSLQCQREGCPYYIHPSHVAALRNQRTPGTVEIPNEELEALRRAWLPMAKGRSWARSSWSDELMATEAALHAILAHLPVKRSHVAEIRLMIDFRREQLASNDYARTARERILHEIAALEAAIEWGKKLGEKP